MTETDRAPREFETREENVRPTTWSPPELLPNPHPKPGVRYRWMRVSIVGDPDPVNVARYRREGWEIVPPSEVPECGIDTSEDRVEIGGLVLVRIDEALIKQRDAYYANLAKAQLDAVDNQLMSAQDARMPTMFREVSSRTTRGGSE